MREWNSAGPNASPFSRPDRTRSLRAKRCRPHRRTRRLGRLEQILSGWRFGHGFAALGIASFGPLDLDPRLPSYGQITSTPKPGWRGADVLGRLQTAAGVPAAFDTDVNGAALAEMRWGAGQGLDDFAYITVGTGVGVGLIVNGKPTRGFGHCELGHIRVARFPGDDFAGLLPVPWRLRRRPRGRSFAEGRRAGECDATLGPDDPVWQSVAWAIAQLATQSSAPRRRARSRSAAGWSRTSRICSSGSSACWWTASTAICSFRAGANYVRAPALGGERRTVGRNRARYVG